ncbi:MAG: hypothetical protein HFI40_04310 [Lachnospiraceae bacterium]|nr:hypothetical protein [Lachnospiraceae bacterium]
MTIKDRKNRRAVVIETKVTDSESKLGSACEAALTQITERQYATAIKKVGYTQVFSLGIAFYQKQCRVKMV